MTSEPGRPTEVVYVVEDDLASAKATARVLEAAGLLVRLYPSAAQFLASRPFDRGCVVLDLSLPDVDGLAIQEHLAGIEGAPPILFLTGHGDVPRSTQAMKAGAIDFLTKPVDAPALLAAVHRALERDRVSQGILARKRAARGRYERLTPREREVFAHVISGQLNKQIAFDLGTSEHTIKVHRQRVMEKLEADSVPDLVRLAVDLDVTPTGSVR